jgi:hypothetical protein
MLLWVHLNFHEKNAIFRQHTFDSIEHGYPFNFDVLKYFSTFCFHDLYQFGGCKQGKVDDSLRNVKKLLVVMKKF